MTYSAADVYRQFSLLPAHLLLWLLWMGLVIFVAPLFLSRHRPARVVVLAQIGTIALGMILAMQFGLSRILGISHLIFWTPLVVHLGRFLRSRPPRNTLALWAYLFVLTASVSLAIDAIDLVRFVAGDRGLLVSPP